MDDLDTAVVQSCGGSCSQRADRQRRHDRPRRTSLTAAPPRPARGAFAHRDIIGRTEDALTIGAGPWSSPTRRGPTATGDARLRRPAAAGRGAQRGGVDRRGPADRRGSRLGIIAEQLDASIVAVSWAVTANLLAAAAATPLIGRLADLHSKKRVLLSCSPSCWSVRCSRPSRRRWPC